MNTCLHCKTIPTKYIYCSKECRNKEYQSYVIPPKNTKFIAIPNNKKPKLKSRARIVSKHSMKDAPWNRNYATGT